MIRKICGVQDIAINKPTKDIRTSIITVSLIWGAKHPSHLSVDVVKKTDLASPPQTILPICGGGVGEQVG